MVIVESISYVKEVMVRVMVFNATFNNTSVKSWQSVLLAEETRVPGENHRHAVNKVKNKKCSMVFILPQVGVELSKLIIFTFISYHFTCWWTISYRGCHLSSSQCFNTDMAYYIYIFVWTLQFIKSVLLLYISSRPSLLKIIGPISKGNKNS
jgi:hypothetical protein